MGQVMACVKMGRQELQVSPAVSAVGCLVTADDGVQLPKPRARRHFEARVGRTVVDSCFVAPGAYALACGGHGFHLLPADDGLVVREGLLD